MSLEPGVAGNVFWRWACSREVQGREKSRCKSKGMKPLSNSLSDSALSAMAPNIRTSDPIEDHGALFFMLHSTNLPKAPRTKEQEEQAKAAKEGYSSSPWWSQGAELEGIAESCCTASSMSMPASSLGPLASGISASSPNRQPMRSRSQLSASGPLRAAATNAVNGVEGAKMLKSLKAAAARQNAAHARDKARIPRS